MFRHFSCCGGLILLMLFLFSVYFCLFLKDRKNEEVEIERNSIKCSGSEDGEYLREVGQGET